MRMTEQDFVGMFILMYRIDCIASICEQRFVGIFFFDALQLGQSLDANKPRVDVRIAHHVAQDGHIFLVHLPRRSVGTIYAKFLGRVVLMTHTTVEIVAECIATAAKHCAVQPSVDKC